MTIRTAVLGFGLSGRIFHAPFVAANPAFELAAVVTGNPGRRDQAKAEYPEVEVLGSVDEVFNRADDFDLVVIGTPSGTHVDLAGRALESGLNVVVDKPFAVTSEEGRALVAKAEQIGKVLTVFQNRRWDGDFLTLKKLIEAGDLGEVRRYESRFERWKPEQGSASTGGATWKTTSARTEGGGIIYDLGSHLVDQAVQLFGPVAEVYSEIDTRRRQVNAEDDAFIALHHESGVRSQLWMSAVAPGPAPRFHVAGSEAGFTSWGLDPQESQLVAGMRPGDPGLGVVSEERCGTRWVGPEQQSVPTDKGDYAEFYRLLADAVEGTGPLPVDPSDAVYCLEVIERAFTQSAR